jgi:vacuolar-type H+-ATPase subunit E/Vma4
MSDNETFSTGRERLIESLWEDARKEGEQILLKARSEARRLLEDVKSFRERELALSVEKARQEALPHIARVLNKARAQARRIALEERYAFLESCFADALRLLAEDSDFREEVRASSPRLLEPVLSGAGFWDRIEVHLNPADKERALSLLKKRRLRGNFVEEDSIIGGAKVVLDGTKILDNTIDGRLGVLRESPPIEILRLFESAGKTEQPATRAETGAPEPQETG